MHAMLRGRALRFTHTLPEGSRPRFPPLRRPHEEYQDMSARQTQNKACRTHRRAQPSANEATWLTVPCHTQLLQMSGGVPIQTNKYLAVVSITGRGGAWTSPFARSTLLP